MHGQDILGLAIGRETVGARQDVASARPGFLDSPLHFGFCFLRGPLRQGIVKIDIAHQADPPAISLLDLCNIHGIGFKVGKAVHPEAEKVIEDGHQVSIAMIDPGNLDPIGNFLHPAGGRVPG